MTVERDPALDTARLRAAAAAIGIDLGTEHLRAMAEHAEVLAAANSQGNLTRITDPGDVAVGHMADSLACLAALDPRLTTQNASEAGPSVVDPSVVDVGSGAGFPGLPLAVVRPNWSFTLVEANHRKAAFLGRTVGALALGNAAVVVGRAEEVGHTLDHRGRHWVAVARAVAPLAVLVEYLLPLVRLGGWAVAMKGTRPGPEISGAAAALEALGGRVDEVVPYRLPGLEARHLVVVAKVAPTAPQLPRRPGRPAKRPLGG